MHSQGGRIAIEWPRDCLYWDYPAVQEALQEFGLDCYECHGCALGLKAPTGGPVFKPWCIATNDEYVGGALSRRKCVGGHVHTPCAGSVTKMTEEYTDTMARPVHRAWASSVSQRQGDFYACPVLPRSRDSSEVPDLAETSDLGFPRMPVVWNVKTIKLLVHLLFHYLLLVHVDGLITSESFNVWADNRCPISNWER